MEKGGLAVSTDWIVLFAMLLVLLRLDRLSKQVVAMCANIRAELAPTEDRGREIITEWREIQRQQAKDRWQFFVFWESLLPL
jgi:hypothetical protein